MALCQIFDVGVLRRGDGISARVVEIACGDHYNGPRSQSRAQKPEEQIVGEMIHGEGRLQSLLGALIDVTDLGASVEHQSVDMRVTQPLFDRSRKTAYAGEPHQIERQ